LDAWQHCPNGDRGRVELLSRPAAVAATAASQRVPRWCLAVFEAMPVVLSVLAVLTTMLVVLAVLVVIAAMLAVIAVPAVPAVPAVDGRGCGCGCGYVAYW
jgi:hypothetical protein